MKIKIKFPDRIEEHDAQFFTGFFDKNGREIYTGDIIVNDNYPKKEWVVEYNRKAGLIQCYLNGERDSLEKGFLLMALTSAKDMNVLAQSFYVK